MNLGVFCGHSRFELRHLVRVHIHLFEHLSREAARCRAGCGDHAIFWKSGGCDGIERGACIVLGIPGEGTGVVRAVAQRVEQSCAGNSQCTATYIRADGAARVLDPQRIAHVGCLTDLPDCGAYEDYGIRGPSCQRRKVVRNTRLQPRCDRISPVVGAKKFHIKPVERPVGSRDQGMLPIGEPL